MPELFQFLGGARVGEPISVEAAVFALLMALILSLLVSGVYTWTFRGMSYTRSFVHSLATGSVVACMVMLAVNNNIAAGVGIAGSLSMVRFRTSMRDPRDMVFVFAALGSGLASGLHAYQVAVAGTGVFCLTAVAMTIFDFGSHKQFDGLLRFTTPSGDEQAESRIGKILKAQTTWFTLVTVREVAQGEQMEHAYQVRFLRPSARAKLLHRLEADDGVRDVSIHLQDHTVEI